ncbi:MAG: hydroxymethylpyrimidine/phosphomethylpyrimidine kinase, partial [Pseudomonadota bacterium]
MKNTTPPRILAIAGSDSSGGAGIQADIKTITMLGGYAMTAITAATAQNSIGVQSITPFAGSFVATQIRSCIDDIGVDAIKIGMLHDTGIIESTAEALHDVVVPIILDPVMIATSGATLIDKPAIAAMRDYLFPLATLLTPNLPELELLTDTVPRTAEAMGESAMKLAEAYGCHVLA